MSLPANIDTAGAQLPAVYESAKQALADCASVDECQTWADKAAALASYARQAEDPSLHLYAQRIQARAIRRAGQLLTQIEPQQGARTDTEPREGDRPKLTRSQAATEAGMSDHQRKQALRVANVSDESFDQQVDSDAPPTVTQLADQGTQKQPPRKQFKAATDAVGALRYFVEKAQKHDPADVVNGLMPSEVRAAADLVAKADAWLDTFIVILRSDRNA